MNIYIARHWQAFPFGCAAQVQTYILAEDLTSAVDKAERWVNEPAKWRSRLLGVELLSDKVVS